MYAEKNGYTTQVNAFRTCQNQALALNTAAKRNVARKACYTLLASSVGNAMGNSEEFMFMTSYTASSLNPWNKDHLT
jgi:hypothetical protein